LARRGRGRRLGMNAVPEAFWIVAATPRAAAVVNVSPARIYVDVDGKTIELDREAFVRDGQVRAPDVADAPTVPLLATTEGEARSRGLALQEVTGSSLDERIRGLKVARLRLKKELAQAKKERNRARSGDRS
jgi:hypothetical protein